jgi:hypothetical protein
VLDHTYVLKKMHGVVSFAATSLAGQKVAAWPMELGTVVPFGAGRLVEIDTGFQRTCSTVSRSSFRPPIGSRQPRHFDKSDTRYNETHVQRS